MQPDYEIWSEYDMRNIFLEKSSTKSGGETNPRLFSKNLRWSESGSIG